VFYVTSPVRNISQTTNDNNHRPDSIEFYYGSVTLSVCVSHSIPTPSLSMRYCQICCLDDDFRPEGMFYDMTTSVSRCNSSNNYWPNNSGTFCQVDCFVIRQSLIRSRDRNQQLLPNYSDNAPILINKTNHNKINCLKPDGDVNKEQL